MHGSAGCDFSVIVPFADDEDCVGALVRRAAHHLEALGVAYEILAINEGSGDNSVALLSYLREHLPALTLLSAPRGVGFANGAAVARGRALLLWEPAQAAAPLAPLSWARARLDGDALDVAVVPGRYTLCRRARSWRALARARGHGAAFERCLVRYATRHGLRVETPAQIVSAGPLVRWVARLRRT